MRGPGHLELCQCMATWVFAGLLACCARGGSSTEGLSFVRRPVTFQPNVSSILAAFAADEGVGTMFSLLDLDRNGFVSAQEVQGFSTRVREGVNRASTPSPLAMAALENLLHKDSVQHKASQQGEEDVEEPPSGEEEEGQEGILARGAAYRGEDMSLPHYEAPTSPPLSV